MPTYVYRREDGSTFELFQSITSDALKLCPDTNQPVQRVISGGTGFILKGSGFYKTDYVDTPSDSNGTDAKTEASDKKEADKPAAKTEAKAETTAPAESE